MFRCSWVNPIRPIPAYRNPPDRTIVALLFPPFEHVPGRVVGVFKSLQLPGEWRAYSQVGSGRDTSG